MIRVIVLIMLFLVILYIYTFVKIRRNRRRRETEPTFVEQYHKKYADLRARTRNQNNYKNPSSDIRNYVTKYNSSVDYVEKHSSGRKESGSI